MTAATVLGRRLMPWQLDTFDVAGELVADPDSGAPIPAYDTVVVSVGRRAGKSLLMLVRILTALAGPHRRCWYTAQARADAATQLRDEWAPLIRWSPFVDELVIREANGSEAIQAPARDSLARLFAPKPTALHGSTGDLIVFDEAWAHSRERGRDLVVAASPLMATRVGAQLWIVSAAGTHESTWWADWIDTGRTAVAADTGRGVCYVEYSADVDDVDLDDPAVWIAAHPAVRHDANPGGTITLDWLHAEHASDRDYFNRVYLNITDSAGVTTRSPMPLADWIACHTIEAPPPADAITTVAVDCAEDQEHTAVVVCTVVDGVARLTVDSYRPGSTWAVARVVALVDAGIVETVVVDGAGPSGVLVAPLVAAAVPLTVAAVRDTAAACAQLAAAVTGRAVAVDEHVALDVAVDGARRVRVGDGAWRWGRRDSAVDVSPLIAAALARWAHPDVHAAYGALS